MMRRPRRMSPRPVPEADDSQPTCSARKLGNGTNGPTGPTAEALYKARRRRRDRLHGLLAANRAKARKLGDTAPTGGKWPWPHGDPAFASGFRRAETTIDQRRNAARKGKRFRFPSSLLRAAFPPEQFGLCTDCTNDQLSIALDQSWLAARGYVISGAFGVAGDADADGCTAPQTISVAVPGPIDPEDEAAFWLAFEEAAFQLPPWHTQFHLDACADQAWNECFAPPPGSTNDPLPITAREMVWAGVPAWCWVDEPFCEAFAKLFSALPDNCSNDALASAIEEAWEESQGENWQ